MALKNTFLFLTSVFLMQSNSLLIPLALIKVLKINMKNIFDSIVDNSESTYLSMIDQIDGDLVAVLKIDGELKKDEVKKTIIEKALKAASEHYCLEECEVVKEDGFEDLSRWSSSLIVEAEEIKGDLDTSSRYLLELKIVSVSYLARQILNIY